MRIISPGNRRTLRESSCLFPVEDRLSYWFLCTLMTTTYDPCSKCRYTSKYCAESARAKGSCQRLLASFFFALRFELRAMTDDRNNWISGCLKYAHFKRTAEWILERWASYGSWEIRFGSTLRNSALEYKCIFEYVKKILDDAFNDIPKKKRQLSLRNRNYFNKKRGKYSDYFYEEISCKNWIISFSKFTINSKSHIYIYSEYILIFWKNDIS